MKAIRTITLIAIFLSFFSELSIAQTIVPNGNFENWENVGSSDEEPTNWNGNKTGTGFASFGPQTCFRETTNPHSGTYCMKLENGNFFGTPVNATATTGQIQAPSSNPADGYISTITGDPNFNSSFTARPDSLIGWFRYTQGGTDIGRISAYLHDNYDFEEPDQGGSATHLIASAIYDVPNGSTANWTRFSVPFTYATGTIGSATPTHILLIATASSVAGSASTSTIFWVDDLEVVYCTDKMATLNINACDSYTDANGNTYTSSTTYMDTVTNVAGLSESCDSIYTINLTITNIDTSVSANANGLTSNSGTGSFQWLDCDNANSPINGATSATFNPSVSGNYAVEITENGCTDTSSCYAYTITAIDKLTHTSEIKLYPNPNYGNFFINMNGYSMDETTVEILNINGQVIYSKNYSGLDKIQVNEALKTGLYFVRVTQKQTSSSFKIIVE